MILLQTCDHDSSINFLLSAIKSSDLLVQTNITKQTFVHLKWKPNCLLVLFTTLIYFWKHFLNLFLYNKNTTDCFMIYSWKKCDFNYKQQDILKATKLK